MHIVCAARITRLGRISPSFCDTHPPRFHEPPPPLLARDIFLFQLLLGEVPERSVFNQKGFVVSLKPYLALTQAVRQGDLVEFNRIVGEVGP